MKTFAQVFGHEPQAVAEAPGRVNLLGEHTDYNDGYVLPTAVPMKTRISVSVAKSAGATAVCRLHAATLAASASFTLDEPPEPRFAKYVYGCLRELIEQGIDIPPLDIHVVSSLPIGVGLSSSAALEVATLRAVCSLLGVELDAIVLARLAQQAEIRYAGVQCGILDQIACSIADPEHMLFVDTCTLDYRLLPLPADAEIMVIHCGVARALANTGYNVRRRECEVAARLLDVPSLRDVDEAGDAAAISRLPETLQRRVNHVLSENRRVMAAIGEIGKGMGNQGTGSPGTGQTISAARFGALMNESQLSLQRDYEVSTAELDNLTALMRAQPTVYGAKLSGAGFGGACVALCQSGSAPDTAARVIEAYGRSGYRGQVLVPVPP